MFVKTSSLHILAALAPFASAVPAKNAGARELKARDMPRPRFGNVPYGQRLGVNVSPCTAPGKIALTFDDGPSVYTRTIVDTLGVHGIKATFFMVGTNGDSGLVREEFHDLVKFMHAQGHHLAGHSWSHPDMSTISQDEIRSEMTKNEEAFANVMGFVPTYFRPPYTSCNDACYEVLDELAYHVVDYNLDTLDWDVTKDSEAIFANAMSNANLATDSFISLAHDIQPATANGLVEKMISMAQAKGLSFVTLGECFGDAPQNWYRDPVTGEAFGGAANPPANPPVEEPVSTPTEPASDPVSAPTEAANEPVVTPTGGASEPVVTPTGTGNGSGSAGPTGGAASYPVNQPTNPSAPYQTNTPGRYNNGTVVTLVNTAYTTYCPPSSTPGGPPVAPPAPTDTTKVPIPGPNPTEYPCVKCHGNVGEHTPIVDHYPTVKGGQPPFGTGALYPTGTGALYPTVKTNQPVGTGVPVKPTAAAVQTYPVSPAVTTSPPTVTGSAAGLRGSAFAATVAAAMAFFLL